MRISDWSSDVCSSDLNVARALRQRGACDGTKVAFYMRNRPEYGELMAACFKGRLTHVNINYRYVAEEVLYIFADSDSEVIVYSSEFRDCKIGRAHVCTPVTNAHLVCRLLLAQKKPVTTHM